MKCHAAFARTKGLVDLVALGAGESAVAAGALPAQSMSRAGWRKLGTIEARSAERRDSVAPPVFAGCDAARRCAGRRIGRGATNATKPPRGHCDRGARETGDWRPGGAARPNNDDSVARICYTESG